MYHSPNGIIVTETAVVCCISLVDRVGIKWMKMKRKMMLITALNIHVIQVKFVFCLSINNFHFLVCVGVERYLL